MDSGRAECAKRGVSLADYPRGGALRAGGLQEVFILPAFRQTFTPLAVV